MTEAERSCLYWARKVNDESDVGLYGPSLRTSGHIPECEVMVRAGFLTRVEPDTRARVGRGGYWITDAGREVLRKLEEA